MEMLAMLEYNWPIVLIVVSNVFYHVCSKSTPADVHPLASLTVTYLVGAAVSAGLYLLLNRGGSLLAEYRCLNWSSVVLGLAIVGLEAGSIYMYKVGWNISTGQLVHSSILAVVLILIGYVFYHEAITGTKIAGILVCMAGLYLINR
jgi:drug/metabolite transporter (DMT)-like permease